MRYFHELDPDEFKDSVLFVDLDGTLVADGAYELAPREADALARLTQGALVYLVSGKGHHRAPAIAQAHGAEALVTGAMKPSKRVIAGAALPERPRVVVGDKLLTDGMLARAIGARYVRVARIIDGTESVFIALQNVIDDVAWTVLEALRAVRRSTAWLYVRLARPRQWVKNLLIFLPLALAGVSDVSHLLTAFAAVIAFSAAAGASYVVNDIIDCKEDARDPRKRTRPIACGIVPVPYATLYALALAALALIAAALAPVAIPYLITYLVLTHLYTFYLKRVPVVELVSIAGFYLIRVMAGAALAGVLLPQSFILVVLSASLLAASGGRYRASLRERAQAIVARYPPEFLRLLPTLAGTLTVFFFALFTYQEPFATALIADGAVLLVVLGYMMSIYRA